MSEFVSYAELSQKTAFCYKNIIRNAKLRKLTSVDFFKTKKQGRMKRLKAATVFIWDI